MFYKNSIKDNNAFTLIELVMVLVLIGIVGIIGVVGLGSAVSSDRAIYERQFESSIRYAQQYSMSHYCFAFVVFGLSANSNSCSVSSGGVNSGAEYGGYQICACPSSNSTINSGGTSSAPVLINNPLAQVAGYFQTAFNYNIKYSVQNNANAAPNITGNYFAFNSEGQPGVFSASASADAFCSPQSAQYFTPFSVAADSAADYFINISFGDKPSDSFYVYPNTGLVSSSGTLQ
ncbi:MAG: prepilin-type N-terminal cleavage/methylation domain-containing protein [Candidatus Acididesulfobacter guangdongensis]|uniref:Prepilin-type N-terminal cleavage/methylation domain-containing protein n=1 Tax=Acididesulfobacter guangdongensis TaxID=2597225 RepID=A0A519BIY6_ACIG2|nr:MAG: prepilin-type N-terminal cleavage/methylation domain-containing protein [Candidatus Acididesulfobacter guangdongensis]